MSIITLITNTGDKDYYNASIKGNILKQNPNVNIIDISSFATFNINQLAFIFKSSYLNFPDNTIHIINVDPHYSDKAKILITVVNNQILIAPDNGILTLITGNKELDYFEIPNLFNNELQKIYQITSKMIDIACSISLGSSIESLAVKTTDFKFKTFVSPILIENRIIATVIYVDSFGGLYLNVTKEYFKDVVGDRAFIITIRKKENVTRISDHFNEVEEGDSLAYWGATDYLQISINYGNASQLFGLKEGSNITIEIL